MTEARGPFGPRHRWSLWIVGRWPSPDTQIPGGAAPREAPFVGVSAGSGPLPPRGPYAAARQRPRGRSDGITCVRTGSEGYSGGNWMVVVAPPVRRGRSARPGDACRPFWIHLHTLRPSGGSWARRGQPRLRGGRLARAPIRY
ncbi:hypothetical protein V6Z77_007196 [Aspergillus fumigatus]